MDVFELRKSLVHDYETYIKSFIQIQDKHIHEKVEAEFRNGRLWPDPLIQLNPSFKSGKSIEALVEEKVLHPECKTIFRRDKTPEDQSGFALNLYCHQEEAIRIAAKEENYVLSTGTGSGKSLSYIIPVVDYALKHRDQKGIKAILIYPMNALANSQEEELRKFVDAGYPDNKGPITFRRYTGQESKDEKIAIVQNPPDILLTNYVMLELILTRPDDQRLLQSANTLKFIVLDELHTFRGRQGADVAMLLRRLKTMLPNNRIQMVGTSATLSTEGTFIDQQKAISAVASKLFGEIVQPDHVIGETLIRTTPETNLESSENITLLSNRIKEISQKGFSVEYHPFISDPIAIWLESCFGLEIESGTLRLKRKSPRSLKQAVNELSEKTNLDPDICAKAIQDCLMASYRCEGHPKTGQKPFAFRLHQFISKGGSVFASLEQPDMRYLTLEGQRFVPDDRTKRLYPLAFCRECGQEYYIVQKTRDEDGIPLFVPRENIVYEDDIDLGYLYQNPDKPWPGDFADQCDRLPSDWIDETTDGRRIVKRDKRQSVPELFRLNTSGRLDHNSGLEMWYVTMPFRFCMNCGIEWSGRGNDFAKLATLGTEGRSSATTILSLSALRYLKTTDQLKNEARKLLSFTDNRQDASLQAGHFNDFVRVGLLRAALYKALRAAGKEGLRYDSIAEKVQEALGLSIHEYARNPEEKFLHKSETDQALRDVLGYRLFHDLRRGWRIMAPNLEQCGLLKIHYLCLTELCHSDSEWIGLHPILEMASPQLRVKLCTTLLDYLRRELAIRTDYLSANNQEKMKRRSEQKLLSPWAIDENDKLVSAPVAFTGSRPKNSVEGNVFVSSRSGFSRYMNRLFKDDLNESLNLENREIVIQHLFQVLCEAGLLTNVHQERDSIGYQIPASALHWVVGDGKNGWYDPIAIPNLGEMRRQPNVYFKQMYENALDTLKGFSAREHTAQVSAKVREERETQFGTAELPLMFCSPTMELGVDIRQLNVVSMRNVPPTPANYAQRSGRAGRSGQPALVFTYCAYGSPHDQYFFQRPEAMVSGAVSPPCIDLANEDLIRSHIQAIWLSAIAHAGTGFGETLCNVLDLGVTANGVPTLPIDKQLAERMKQPEINNWTLERSHRVLDIVKNELSDASWYHPRWLEHTLQSVYNQFDSACDRWRELYRSAYEQADHQHRISMDASKPFKDKQRADRLCQEAKSQMNLLTGSDSVMQSDFYPYRYFASEGFLPGYNFPRLPVSAYIPGRRGDGKGRDDYLSRARFLAVSEFGPRSIIYHEGSRYEINRVSRVISSESGNVTLQNAKICNECGYLHNGIAAQFDTCEGCGTLLPMSFDNLFRMQNVSTRRREQINSDEEERLRLGFRLRTGVRFTTHGERPSRRVAQMTLSDDTKLTLIYGDAALIWRLNTGWLKSKTENEGFLIDPDTGYWQRKEKVDLDIEDLEPELKRTLNVIPFVEDYRNCLILKPDLSAFGEDEQKRNAFIASLTAALRRAIQVCYQVEENELAVEPMPTRDNRQEILFYESAEGGAGVLKQLLQDSDALAKVARQALNIIHCEPSKDENTPGISCEAACYKCLMSYYNQPDHAILDHALIKDWLIQIASAKSDCSPNQLSRQDHFEQLMRSCNSRLESNWLTMINNQRLTLPTHGQYRIESCLTRPDFYYADHQVAIYIDGPPHDNPDRHLRDLDQESNLMMAGYTVVRFHHEDDWSSIIARYPGVFGVRG